MYQILNNKDTNGRFATDKLDGQELESLKTAVQGFGNLRGFSRLAKIHENTVRQVLLKGVATKPVATKIRSALKKMAA